MGKGKKKGLARLHDLFKYNLRGTKCGQCGHQMPVATDRMWREIKSIFKAAVNDEVKDKLNAKEKAD